MNDIDKQTMRECTAGSLAGTMSFPQVVARLVSIGCEQYHADLRRQEKTYYMPDGETHIEPLSTGTLAMAEDFSAAYVVDALRAIQERKIQYREFLSQIAAAGCVGYHVFLRGKRAIYYGRSGDHHVELFPPAASAKTD